MKVCRKCGRSLSLAAFGPKRSQCRECRAAHERHHYEGAACAYFVANNAMTCVRAYPRDQSSWCEACRRRMAAKL